MFPFCLINASVTDAEGIRSRLVSFPPTLFSSVCHIAFPVVLFKKQTGSAFAAFLFFFFLLSSCCFYVVFVKYVLQTRFFFPLSQIDCWASFHIMPNCSARYCYTEDFPAWFDRFHFTALALCVLLFSSVTHHFTFINLTHQSWRPYLRRIQEVSFFPDKAGNGMDRFWADSGACLATQR